MGNVHAVSVQVTLDGGSLCAFVAPSDVDGELVRSRIAEKLPRYMVPSIVYCLDKLPLNSNDKVNHKLIKSSMPSLIAKSGVQLRPSVPSETTRPAVLHRTVSSNSSTSTVPSSRSSATTRVESHAGILEKIWNDVLNLSGPRLMTDDFFKLGGDR
jgi:hypothetical protein